MRLGNLIWGVSWLEYNSSLSTTRILGYEAQVQAEAQEEEQSWGATCVHTGTLYQAAGHTIHSQEYGQWVWRVYDVYERMNYVHTFEKPKVWTV
jgi:hypothetical protein